MATRTVGKLDLRLDANTARLSKGLDQAKRKVSAFAAPFKGLGSKIAAGLTSPIAAAAAATVSLSTAMGAVVGHMQRLDQTAKFAGRIGESVEKLSALQFAACLLVHVIIT